MEQEILSPESQPKSASQGFSSLAGLVAAFGATLLLFCLTGAAMVATVWAVSKLFGFPDLLLYGLLVISAIPVLWLTAWTAGRAWHVEKLLAAHRDIDSPEFKLGHYFRNG
ncbi:MAG: hypothetical protein KDK75_06065 [Alphaproteobacteria bacterium]|nr:hypothetical protein [Alphaproteobacteria bacterium]